MTANPLAVLAPAVLKPGDLVIYHGSLSYFHGQTYRVEAVPVSPAALSPRYHLTPTDPELPDLFGVRRASITFVLPAATDEEAAA